MPTIPQNAPNFIPRKDQDAAAFFTSFANVIQKCPAAYALLPGDSAVISSVAANFSAALAVTVNPSTRTTTASANKNELRAQAEATIRMYAANIRDNQGITTEQKLALGLRVRPGRPSPIPAPTTAPVLSAEPRGGGRHIVRYEDEAMRGSRAKPPGVRALVLFTHTGPVPVTNYEVASYQGQYGRQPIEIAYHPEDAGKTVTMFGRWVNPKGQPGPWSLPFSMQIAFGGPIVQQEAA